MIDKIITNNEQLILNEMILVETTNKNNMYKHPQIDLYLKTEKMYWGHQKIKNTYMQLDLFESQNQYTTN